jgi:hypothetical protein
MIEKFSSTPSSPSSSIIDAAMGFFADGSHRRQAVVVELRFMVVMFGFGDG